MLYSALLHDVRSIDWSSLLPDKSVLPWVILMFVIAIAGIVLLFIESRRLPKGERAFPYGLIAGYVFSMLIGGGFALLGCVALTIYYFVDKKRKAKTREVGGASAE